MESSKPTALASVDPKLEEGWKRELAEEFQQEYFLELKRFLLAEKSKGVVMYPPGSLIFNAFNSTPFDAVKVVILGQDPYPGPGQAHGLCFSVARGVTPPASLQNIFKELQDDVHFKPPGHGNLESWARQGVLLLNTCLTVRAGAPASHQGHGWETFTTAAIRKLSEKRNGLVFLLWGRPAQEKESLIDLSKHFVLKAPHPSPLAAYRGFFGCRHFSRANEILQRIGKAPMDWQI